MTSLKGLCVGASMLVPGVSGGSMAMILGIYDQLVTSVSSFFEHKRKSLLFLGIFSLGAMVGILLFANPLLRLIESYPKPMLFFFMGAVAGGIPMMVRKAQVTRISFPVFCFPLLGACLVFLLSKIPTGLFEVGTEASAVKILMLLLAGIIAAVALILPGISVSYMLLVMGMYDQTIEAITGFQILYLLPLGIGLLLGIILTTRILERVMTQFPKITYLIILGFVLGSIAQVFPGLPVGWEILICPITFVLGLLGIWKLSSLE